MRKNVNTTTVQGYIYDKSKLNIKESGPASKNPGTVYISGDLDVATDEEGLNVVSVHFTYVTAIYAKSGKTNNTFTALKKIIETPDNTWIEGGKENAVKVKVDGSLAVNDFYAADGSLVSAKRNEGSFVTILPELPMENERSRFDVDMIITGVSHVDADPDKNIAEDYTRVSGAVFNFRNDLLPVELVVRHPGGMKYFEDLGVTNSEPVYTKIWGSIASQTIKVEKSEESAFGEASVTVYERKSREYRVTGTAKVPYDFGDESVMTAEDLTKAVQNRQVMLAELKKRDEEYKASRNNAIPETPSIKINDSAQAWKF